MELFDWGWKFHGGELENGHKIDIEDAHWRLVDLPHDWSIEGPFVHDLPRYKALDDYFAENEGVSLDESLSASLHGYRAGGIAWYRKHFSVAEDAKNKRAFILFEGVFMDAEVWLNGERLGKQPYGYSSFIFDLTPLIRHDGADNIIALRVNVQQPCSGHYTGVGIYRHVWLSFLSSVHIDLWGTYVTTPSVSSEEAVVRVRTTVQNHDSDACEVTLESRIVNARGETVASIVSSSTAEPGVTSEFDQYAQIANPDLWSLDSPNLYSLISTLASGTAVLEEKITPFGIRTFEFTKDQGLMLNGKRVNLQGVCIHHGLGPLGACEFDRGLEHRLEVLKDMGCNALRSSHNPAAPALLDLCDRMGFIVVDEAFDEWRETEMPYGYCRFFDEWSEHDVVSMIRRGRNHPCIFLWNIGNEVKEQKTENGGEMAKRLAEICHREDPTRPVIASCQDPLDAMKNGFIEALDVVGINYKLDVHEQLRGQKPQIATETTAALSTRGEYNLVLENGEVVIKPQIGHVFTSYDLAVLNFKDVACAAPRSFTIDAMKRYPWVAGQFVWSGIDYIGEPLPLQWPANSSYFGILDLCAFPKDCFYLYQSAWTDKHVLHILPHWNWPEFEGKNIPVWCYSNCDSVEMYLNDVSYGEREKSEMDEYQFEWSIPYENGTLRAVGKKDGKVVCAKEMKTAGLPAQIELLPDRFSIHADGQDLSHVTVRILDANGILCPDADHKIHFEVEGKGRLVAVGNGDPISLEPFDTTERKAFHGLCLAVLRSGREPGEIRMRATAEGLEETEIIISTKAG